MTHALMLPMIFLALLQVPPKEAASGISSQAGGIRGRYYLVAGPPVAGALAVVRHSDGRSWKAQTDAAGEFRMGMLPAGLYSLAVSKGGLHPFRRKEIRVIQGAWFVWDPPCGATTSAGMPDPGPGAAKDKSHYEYAFGSGLVNAKPEIQKIPTH